MAQPAAKRSRNGARTGLTYADYRTWPDDERWEIIEGEAFAMSPAPGTAHQEISSNLHGLLWNYFREKPCKVFHAPFDVRLPKAREADDRIKSVVQPDIVIVGDEHKLDAKGLRGAPDVAIEILSPSTASKDHIRKRALYEKHGVKVYWLIDPDSRMVTAYERVPNGGFGPPQILDGEGLKLEMAPFPGLIVDFREVFPPKPKIVRESPSRYL